LELPWKPKSFDEIFASAKLLRRDGTHCLGQDLRGKVFGLYFSAHWCPPCRGFTPKLAEWYNKDLKDKGFEIVFVSSDKEAGQFQEYFEEQPWLALDYADRKTKEQLSSCFGVRGIPSFVIIDKDGSVITKEGREAVSADPTGVDFPWYPKPVKNLAAGPGGINETPTIVAFCETSDAKTKKIVEDALQPLAEKYIADAKTQGDEDPQLAFVIATEGGGLSDKLRELLNMASANPESPPRLMLVDIPDDGAYYEGPEGEITAAVVDQFVSNYTSKSLERKQLQG